MAQVNCEQLASYQKKILSIVFFFAAGIYFGVHMMGWSTTEAAYWLTVTVTTVGYGDYSPNENDTTKLAGCVFILVGIALVADFLQEFVGDFFSSVQDAFVEEADDEKQEKAPKTSWMSDQMFANLLFLVTVAGGTYFFHRVEGWSYVDGLYWTICTVTTVGYGDMSTESDTTRQFSIFYIVVSIWTFSNVVSQIAETKLKQQLEKRRQKMMASFRISEKMIAKMDQATEDRDGDGTLDKDHKVSSGEFLMHCLGPDGLKMVPRADSIQMLKLFEELDTTNDGFLTLQDLQTGLVGKGVKADATPAPAVEVNQVAIPEGSVL